MQSENKTKEHEMITLRHYLPIIFTLGLGIVLSFMLFVIVNSREQANKRMEFESRSKAHANAVENNLNEYLGALSFIGDLFDNSVYVSRQAFSGFVKKVLSRYPGIQAFSWNPLVMDNERSVFEARAREDGIKDFMFTERTEEGELVNAAQRKEYVVVYYIDPLETNKPALGYDIASEPARLHAVTQAFNTGKPVATCRITLVQETGNQFGVLILLPIYQQGVPLKTLEERYKYRKGLVVECLRIGDVVEIALEGFPVEGIDFCLYEVSPEKEKYFLYYHPSRMTGMIGQPMEEKAIKRGLHWETNFEFAGRQWEILFKPSPSYPSLRPSWQTWAILSGSLLLTAILAFYMFRRLRYFDEIKRRINKQIQTNRELESEITERKIAEEDLKGIFNLSLDMICSGNLDGYFTKINPSFGRILGYKEEEFLQKPYIEFVYDEDVEKTKEALAEAVKGKRVIYIDNRYKCKEGSLKWIEWSVQVIVQENKFIAVGRDITERKCMEEKLRGLNETLEQRVTERTAELVKANEKIQDSEERLRAIIDNSTAVIYLKDTQGRHIMMNRQYEKLFNLSKNEMIGKTDYDIFPKEIADEFQKNDRKVLESGHPIEFEEIAQHKDGLHTYISLKFPLFDTKNIAYGVCGISTDITERKKMEEELIKIQKLESVGVLAGGIAHDFNNSLQGILSNIALVKTYTNPKDETYGILSQAEKASLQARNLTQQLLTFSRGGEPVKKTLSAMELFKDSANFALSGSNVRCELDIPCNLWPIEADKGQMNQVMNNLYINASQAMPVGGLVKVKAENINIKAKDSFPLQAGRYIKITTEDQGTGIPEEYLQKIFDPYFTTKQKGSGLGLAIVYSIIKKHDGHITVESEIGVGTNFHIYFPASEKEISKERIPDKAEVSCPESVEGISLELVEGKEEIKSTTSEGRILFMDDDGIISLAAAKQLKQIKYEVETAGNGVKAIELYKEAIETHRPFDAVILDLTIVGGMGGEETLKKLLEIDPNIKAIVASGYSNDPVMANFSKYGFKGVVEKPYEIDELDEALQKVIIKKN